MTPTATSHRTSVRVHQQRVGACARNEHDASVRTSGHDAAHGVRGYLAVHKQFCIFRTQEFAQLLILGLVLTPTETEALGMEDLVVSGGEYSS